MSLSSIAGIAGHALHQPANSGIENSSAIAGFQESGKESFASFLDRHVSEVNDLLKVADQKNTEIAVGKTENLHDAMIAVEIASPDTLRNLDRYKQMERRLYFQGGAPSAVLRQANTSSSTRFRTRSSVVRARRLISQVASTSSSTLENA